MFFVVMLLVHIPGQCYARGIAKVQRRKARHAHVLEQRLALNRRGNTRGIKRDGDKGPISRWETIADSYPRLELYAFFLSFQGLAQSTAAAVSNKEGSLGTRIFAAIIFVFVVVCGFLGVAYFVVKKVQAQTRALFIKDRKSGYHVWVDRASALSSKRGYTGFVASPS